MKKIIKWIIIILIIGIIGVLSVNFGVKISTSKQIISEEDYIDLEDIDCILVLGAAIWGDKPSPMLEDRLLTAISLYEQKPTKIIMSGDHGEESYDEVNTMKEYAIEAGIPSEDIFMDHAGFSTYDSIVRAKEIFGAEKIIIVTQKYHLYRALYIANSFDLEAYGIEAVPNDYNGAMSRELREILARDKDFIKCLFKPEPTYLGEEIPVSGNGDITNDQGSIDLNIKENKKE
ncbi:putative SanA protein [Mycoplasma sp. CAG:776]|nr:putative SanA protein [Mycoplasma sp. CAG:776]